MSNRADNFNRANGAVGTPSDGGTAYEVLVGAVNVSSNAAMGTGAARDIGVLETSSTRVDVEVTIPAVPVGQCGPVARVQDGGTFFIAGVRAGINKLQLSRYSGGTNQELIGAYDRTFQVGDVIKLSVDGTDTWRVYVNGTLAIGPFVRSQYNTSTKHGIGYLFSNDKLDTLTITDTNVPLSAGTLSHSSHTHNTATLSWTAAVGGTGSISAQLQRSAAGAGVGTRRIWNSLWSDFNAWGIGVGRIDQIRQGCALAAEYREQRADYFIDVATVQFVEDERLVEVFKKHTGEELESASL